LCCHFFVRCHGHMGNQATWSETTSVCSF
jgi:hypothetical protein